MDPNGYTECVGFGFQGDISTEHGTYGVEVVIYLDPEVVANTTKDGSANSVIAVYSYSGISVSQLEVFLAPQIGELTKAINYEMLNELTVDEMLITLAGLLSEHQGSFSAFLVFGYDTFDHAERYSGDFEAWSFSVSKPGSRLSGGAFYSYSDYCFTVGAKVSYSTDFKTNLFPFYLQYSHTYYSDPVYLNLGERNI